MLGGRSSWQKQGGQKGGTGGLFDHGLAEGGGEQVGELDVAVVEEAKRVGVEA